MSSNQRSDRWQTIERMYHAAIGRPPADRPAFLDEACAGDAALRAEVESLLGYGSAAEAFLEVPAVGLLANTVQMSDTSREPTQTLIGRQIGVFHVLSVLGIGGMGEVYRARDSRLGRDVAIKVLPSFFARDPERLRRFEREARLLASLTHPNIGAIYGIEEADGFPALILELIEGPTLAELIDRPSATGRGLKLDEALTFARQMADALEAAHEKGIVHRDLKPTNVKVTPDGVVKVLDFGIAKVRTRGDTAAEAPTVATVGTRPQVVLGTAAYMSPEQARGQAVDKRTDIWAFGCVLYEMLTGRRAFGGATLSDTIAAILEREPDWRALPVHVPAPIRRLLQRCLEKDLKRRLRDVGDARLDIEEALAPPTATASQDLGRSSARTSKWLWMAVALVAGVLLAQLAPRRLPTQPSSLHVRRFQHTLARPQLLAGASGSLVSISPDGNTLVYRASDNGVFKLYRRSLAEIDAHEIPGTENVREAAFFSHDGRWLGFNVAGTLMKVSLDGTPPVRVTELGGSATRGATWTSDDWIVVGAFNALLRVRASGGDVVTLAKPDDGRAYWYPQSLPGGAVLFTASLQAPDSGDVLAIAPDTGARKAIIRGATAGRYLPTGHLVFVREGALWAVRFDPYRLEASGTPVLVEQGIRVEGGGAVQVALADDGTLAYIPRSTAIVAEPRTLVWVSASGDEQSLDAPVRSYRSVSMSPEGGRVALDIRDQDNDIWIWDLARKVLTRLTFVTAIDEYPVWTNDGQRIIFASLRPGGAGELYSQAADGSGAVEQLTKRGGVAQFPYGMTPDGTGLVILEATTAARGGGDLALLPVGVNAVAAGPARRTLVQTSFTEANAALSPDGRWLAYQSNESGGDEVYVRPFPNVDGGRVQVSAKGGRTPLWARTQERLFYRTADGAVMAVRVEPGPAWANAPPVQALAAGYFDSTGANNRAFDVSPDGQRFLMIKNAETTDTPASTIVIVQNWLEELKRLVPIN